jgi:hypothetical protein
MRAEDGDALARLALQGNASDYAMAPAPRSATGHHRHEYDYVVVPMTGGELTVVGRGRTEPRANCGGSILFPQGRRRARRPKRDRPRDRVLLKEPATVATLTADPNGLTSMPSRLASAMLSQVMDCGTLCVM